MHPIDVAAAWRHHQGYGSRCAAGLRGAIVPAPNPSTTIVRQRREPVVDSPLILGAPPCIDVCRLDPKPCAKGFARLSSAKICLPDPALAVGTGLAAVLFIRRTIELTGAQLVERQQHPQTIGLPDSVLVYDINGPLFFGAAQKELSALTSVRQEVRVMYLGLYRCDPNGSDRRRDSLTPPASSIAPPPTVVGSRPRQADWLAFRRAQPGAEVARRRRDPAWTTCAARRTAR